MTPMHQDESLITVHSFAIKMRVDTTTIRRWIKQGVIHAVLVGPRKMRIRPSDAIRVIGGGAVFSRFDDYPLASDYMTVPVVLPETVTATKSAVDAALAAVEKTNNGERNHSQGQGGAGQGRWRK